MLEIIDSGMGGIHHLADLQVPVSFAAANDLGIERLPAKLPGRLAGPLFIRKNGVELDRMKPGEVKAPFLHAAQYRAADIFV